MRLRLHRARASPMTARGDRNRWVYGTYSTALCQMPPAGELEGRFPRRGGPAEKPETPERRGLTETQVRAETVRLNTANC